MQSASCLLNKIKMRYKIFIPLLFLVIFSCKKEWNTLSDYKELYAAYCTLNLKDSAQYVRINKVFYSMDDPQQYLSISDTVNISPADFEVFMYSWENGIKNPDPIYFYPSQDYLKDSGLFSIEDYFLFKTKELLKIDCKYQLFVRNINTGHEMMAETNLLGRRTLQRSFIESRYYNINQYRPELLDYNGSLNLGQFEKRINRLLYYEIINEDTALKYLDWRPWLEYMKANQDDSDSVQFPNYYLEYIANNMEVIPEAKRIAVGLDKLLILNDEQLAIFIELSNAGSTLHYNPVYTNFNNGTGILSSRYYYTFFAMRLKPETLDTLAYGIVTKDLGFVDANGNWP